ncbi:hypothetical protein D3OALGA1CA_2163 [Olavius algarvensis associated proteobacterium Delta 3]|nr:hypothetical protein D3OALGA1CA_2163 [Olavius algarvensis associated proteobacterium Delta 3]
MIPEEAIPLIEHIDAVIDLLKSKECDDIVSYLVYYKSRIKNDFTATLICGDLAGMCRPEAWGDRYIGGMDRATWLVLLNRLQSVCISTFNDIKKRQAAAP